MFARARPQVDDPIGGMDGFFIMLHHQDGIAQVAQVPQGFQQAGVVARVQANRGLIQHVQHTHQPRADLGSQADALRLTAGKRTGRPPQGQVIQADVDQEPQAGADFLEDAL